MKGPHENEQVKHPFLDRTTLALSVELPGGDRGSSVGIAKSDISGSLKLADEERVLILGPGCTAANCNVLVMQKEICKDVLQSILTRCHPKSSQETDVHAPRNPEVCYYDCLLPLCSTLGVFVMP